MNAERISCREKQRLLQLRNKLHSTYNPLLNQLKCQPTNVFPDAISKLLREQKKLRRDQEVRFVSAQALNHHKPLRMHQFQLIAVNRTAHVLSGQRVK
jgi:hypothetical protein